MLEYMFNENNFFYAILNPYKTSQRKIFLHEMSLVFLCSVRR